MSDGGKSKRPSFLLNGVCLQGVNISLLLYCAGCCVELNMSTRPAGGSSNLSLPGTPGGDMDSANRVLSWAVSFEKLLEDPCGVHHFTVSNMFHLGVVFLFPEVCVFSPFLSLQAFLKSEVSAENILFWQACEKFKKIPAASVDEVR